MQVSKLLLCLILLSLLMACGKQELVPSDYMEWVHDPTNGLVKKKTIHPLEVEVLFKPLDYIIVNEQRTNTIDPSVYKERQLALKGMQYYTLKLGIEGDQYDVTNYEVRTASEQQARLAYLSFSLQRAIKLVENGDTLNCQLFHFERSYDLTPYRTFVLGFEQKEATKYRDKTLIVEPSFSKTGPIKLTFETSNLVAIPNLKL